MKTPTLYLMMGLPGSGKSTASRQLDALRVCHDDICRMVTGAPFRHELGDVYRDIEGMIACYLLARGYDVVVDDNHLTAADRARWVSIASNQNARIVCVVMDTSLEAAMRRNVNPERVAAGHFARPDVYEALVPRVERPSSSEGFHDIITVGTEGES